MDLNIQDFRYWSPIRVYETGGRAFIDWCYLGKDRFTAPFHDDTIENRLREPFNLLFRRQTPIEFLGEIDQRERGIAPTGFIFHVSRCGSTLVSQMLAALSKNIVISEASIIDKIVRANHSFPNISIEQKAIWLRWLFNALARKRFDEEEHFFVKFDSWSVLDLPLIERAFPDTKWIFMYRNPVEVIVSNLREPGIQMIPGAIEAIFPAITDGNFAAFHRRTFCPNHRRVLSIGSEARRQPERKIYQLQSIAGSRDNRNLPAFRRFVFY